MIEAIYAFSAFMIVTTVCALAVVLVNAWVDGKFK